MNTVPNVLSHNENINIPELGIGHHCLDSFIYSNFNEIKIIEYQNSLFRNVCQ